jgi:hypothetical protein
MVAEAVCADDAGVAVSEVRRLEERVGKLEGSWVAKPTEVEILKRRSILAPGKIALEILSGRDLLYGCREADAVMTMARFRTLSARPSAMISAAQCRSARALLGWSVAKLASAASVSANAIDDFEAERRPAVPAVAGPIRRAFEPVGVVFLPGEDVRLRP